MPDSGNPPNSSRNRKVVLWAWVLAGLVVVMIVVLFAFHPTEGVHPRSKEAVLKIDLKTMREAIDKYTLDKKRPPQSLQDLVDEHYLRAIPVDPMTGERDWRAEFGDVRVSPTVVGGGIIDVRSNSGKTALDGTAYDIW